jgi:gamma-glutamyltranspeptidase / glutathione hydrolase
MLGPLGRSVLVPDPVPARHETSVTPGSRSDELGVVAAGHPVSAAAGADALREGGNAVDAALAAMLASFAAEPLLTGLGAGGYMLVVAPGQAPTLLDFFVEAPGRESGPTPRADLLPVRISFGDAVQTFNIGVASVGCFGMPAGVCEASRRFGHLALETLVAPAARLAREGVKLNLQQAYIVELLGGIVTSTPECSALFAPAGQLLRAGQRIYQPELADSLERLGAEGSRPFYEGDIGAAIAAWVGERGGLLARADLEAYVVMDRPPLEVSYRGRDVLINPPPSAGGLLIGRALALLGEIAGPPTVAEAIAVMERVQGERTAEFLDGLNDPEFGMRFLRGEPGPQAAEGRGAGPGAAEGRGAGPGAAEGRGAGPSRLGSTTHISVLDREGWACSVTCSNGSASGVIVPGTGVHLNNMLGEQDLNPHGFHRYPPGRRMPSMMAPTVVLRDGAPALAVGSAGSNRIRSAILQTIIHSLDEGATATEAVDAPRVHWEEGVVYTEPGIDSSALAAVGRELAPFRERNLFFGGVQAAARDTDGRFSGGGDPRRGGASVLVSPA